MMSTNFIPCHLDSMFIRGKDNKFADNALVRLAAIGDVYDRLQTVGQKTLLPYLGALCLVSLKPYCMDTCYDYEASEVMPRALPCLSEEQIDDANRIASEWQLVCPKGSVLLPKPLADLVSMVQAEAWQREITDFKP